MYLEHCRHIWCHYIGKNIFAIKGVLQMFTKFVPVMRVWKGTFLSNEEILSKLGWYSWVLKYRAYLLALHHFKVRESLIQDNERNCFSHNVVNLNNFIHKGTVDFSHLQLLIHFFDGKRIQHQPWSSWMAKQVWWVKSLIHPSICYVLMPLLMWRIIFSWWHST